MSEAPNRVRLYSKNQPYWWRATLLPEIDIRHYGAPVGEYIRADIAEAEKKAAVWEVLETIRHEIKSDVERGIASFNTVLLIEKFILQLLYEATQ